jgi:high-affinity Fe2+/Pb2+ permease
MTTAFAWAVRGRFLAALDAQPAGLALACAAAVGVVVAAWVAASGRPVHRFLQPLASGRIAIIAAGLLLSGWVWKLLVMKGVLP